MTQPGALRVRVREVVRETAEAHSLVLEPADGGTLAYRPGQFLTVRVPAGGGGAAARCYSLASSPLTGEPPKVTVKRTRDGFGSNWICDHVIAGDHLDVLRPSGTFTPDDLGQDLLLLAGGSGITPVMSILKSCLHGGNGRLTLLYANRDEASVIFRDELADLAARSGERLTVLHWLESVQGRPTAGALRALLRPHADRPAYLCGPAPFMDLLREALDGLGVPGRQVHSERFFSLTTDPFTHPGPTEEPAGDGPAATVEATLDGATHTLAWPRGRRLLDVLLEAGIDAPYSCREGACSACACVLTKGEVEMEHNEVLDRADLDDGIVLACQSVPVSDRVEVTYDA
ncbi:ferredoxin--NADP reductase [Nocardiopsis sp. HNM0947]|uniref:Ferredoxin--NADP reductase n=1 Tax=Nocardiopsis coralli TaxID=2772213 RepID=A0ABR9NZU6_9ACTN|nr:ferredoxin--NADP reductase [Nocardiopsis coralli]MBE2997104.1 ferredoxin--NADP reductase [Nocardiopsis coralli]